MSVAIPPRKMQLFIDQQRRCHWCTKLCHLNFQRSGRTPHDLFTEDHIIPRGRGGADKIENIVGACYQCNQFRNMIEMKIQVGKRIDFIGEKPLRERLMPK